MWETLHSYHPNIQNQYNTLIAYSPGHIKSSHEQLFWKSPCAKKTAYSRWTNHRKTSFFIIQTYFKKSQRTIHFFVKQEGLSYYIQDWVICSMSCWGKCKSVNFRKMKNNNILRSDPRRARFVPMSFLKPLPAFLFLNWFRNLFFLICPGEYSLETRLPGCTGWILPRAGFGSGPQQIQFVAAGTAKQKQNLHYH